MAFLQFLKENHEYHALGKEIQDFLSKHGKISGNYDPKWDDESEKWSSPDASLLDAASKELLSGRKPRPVHSEWGSGGYKPYGDQKARKWHDDLIDQISRI